MRVIAGVPLAFAGAAILCRLWLLHPPRAIAIDLAQPVPVVTYWQTFGSAMWLALFIAVAVGGWCYAAALRDALAGTFARTHRALWAIGVASAAALVAAIAFPVIFSSDVYAYGAYGVMAQHSIDPYAHDVLRLHDPLVRAAIWQWSNPPPVCVYGPLFVELARAVVTLLGGFGPAAQLLGLRVAASLALIACGPLLYAALRGYPSSQRIGAAIGITLNPIAIWSCAEGHNDALMLVVVLFGVTLVRSSKPLAGAFAIACSCLVKAPGIAAAFALAVYSWPVRGRFARVVAGAAIGTALTALIALPFEWGVRNVLVPHGHYTPQFSLQYLGSLIAGNYGIAAALIGIGALAIAGLRQTVMGRREGFALLALALWLVIPNPYPWYALWILPVAFASIGTRGSWAIIIASLAAVFRYLPDATTASSTSTNALVTLCMLGIPFAVYAARQRAQNVVTSAPPGNP
ncbi:MAG: hypothetical protein M3R35_07770 [Candidatus Eremiobacteraeota bacterium]|nr:hypothetical protein [Candidatus Eremiobacteraeota bacterium]